MQIVSISKSAGRPVDSPCCGFCQMRLHAGALDILQYILWLEQTQALLHPGLEIPATEFGVGPLGQIELELPELCYFLLDDGK